MKNFLIAMVISVGCYFLGWQVANNWGAGVLTALFGFVLTYFILLRRSFKKLNNLIQEAMGVVQQAQSLQDPNAQLRQLDEGIQIMKKGFSLSSEQFLMKGILNGQVGALEYQAGSILMQLKLREELQHQSVKARKFQSKANARFKEAKVYLEKANEQSWQTKLTRNWHSMAMLAALQFREGEKEEAIKNLKKVKGPGSSDPLYWGMLTWMLYDNNQPEDGLIAVTEGLSKNEESAALKDMANCIQNKKSLSFVKFGMNWFMFFPDHLTRDAAMKLQMEMQEQGNEGAAPMNRAMRRQMKRKT